MNDLLLLAALLDGPKHGWVLKKLSGWATGQGEMHNNLVYPLMKKFATEGWVRRRAEAGHRGQTRAVYSLTVRGKQELFRRLNQFGERESASASEFRLRVGLFAVLSPEMRKHILAERSRWLGAREQRFSDLKKNLEDMPSVPWGLEVVTFLLAEVRSEQSWIAALEEKSRHPANDRPNRRKTRR